MANKAKCCIYIVQDKISPEPNISCAPRDYQEYYMNRLKYYDVGDDPSFYCANKYRYNVTWSVCRHNVRQGIQLGDEIHFVACDKSVKDVWKYFYVGYGIVSKTISHKDIWEHSEYYVYQKYFNNLITLDKDKFIHNEPLPFEYWHEDWKMRISSARTYQQLLQYEENIATGVCGYSSFKIEADKINSEFSFGNNYVVFDLEKSCFNLENPKCVSEVTWKGRELETHWREDYQVYFCENKTIKSFANKRRQHSAFRLLPVNSESLKLTLK